MILLYIFIYFFPDHGPGSDRISDDSSKEAVSDSHPDTLTDPEFSDPPIVTSSPPQSGDEIRRDKEKVKKITIKSKYHGLKYFMKESGRNSHDCLGVRNRVEPITSP